MWKQNVLGRDCRLPKVCNIFCSGGFHVCVLVKVPHVLSFSCKDITFFSYQLLNLYMCWRFTKINICLQLLHGSDLNFDINVFLQLENRSLVSVATLMPQCQNTSCGSHPLCHSVFVLYIFCTIVAVSSSSIMLGWIHNPSSTGQSLIDSSPRTVSAYHGLTPDSHIHTRTGNTGIFCVWGK